MDEEMKKPMNINNIKVKTMSTLQSVRIKFDRKENKKYSVRILDSKIISPNNLELNKSLKNSRILPDYSKVLTESLIEEYENEDKTRRKSQRHIELYYKKDCYLTKNVDFIYEIYKKKKKKKDLLNQIISNARFLTIMDVAKLVELIELNNCSLLNLLDKYQHYFSIDKIKDELM